MSKGKSIGMGLNDDYACAYIQDEDYKDLLMMYYGYEETLCDDHDSQSECWEKDCEESEWAFKFQDENGNSLKYGTKELEEFNPRVVGAMPEAYLLSGILKMLDEGLLELNKNKLAGKALKQN